MVSRATPSWLACSASWVVTPRISGSLPTAPPDVSTLRMPGRQAYGPIDHGWWSYSLCRTRAARFRVAASPGSTAIKVAAASQPTAITASTASGTDTTGVMPS